MVAAMALRVLAVGIGLGVVLIAASAQAQADAAEVEALIAKGNELRRAGTPGPALPYFRRAYELARTPRTTGQLGLAELAAGYPVEAEAHLATALESPNDPGIVKYRQMLKDALTMARAQIGELSVQGAPAGAEVVVNGRVVGALPLPSPVKLPARTTEVVVRAPGHSERREMVPIAGGQRHALTVTLETVEKPIASAPVVTTAPVPSPTPASATPTPLAVGDRAADIGQPSSGLRTAAWLAGGAALVAGGTGLVLHMAARSKATEISAMCANPPQNVAAMPGGPLTFDECQDRLGTWESYRRWSIVSYVSAAALGLTAGVLFWTSRPPSTSASTRNSAQATVRCGPSPSGISCHGVF
jgi:hypothetical protein